METIDECFADLYRYVSRPVAFTADELEAFFDPEIESRLFYRFLEEGNFIRLNYANHEEIFFILDSELLKWYCRLNIRLAGLNLYVLPEKQIASLINRLRSHSSGASVPKLAISWGEKFGFLRKSNKIGYYCFPMARILPLLANSIPDNIFDFLFNIYEEGKKYSSFKELARHYVKSGFSNIDKRISYVIRNRENLNYEKHKSLNDIGNIYGLTRERIRQIEGGFWKKMDLSVTSKPFLKAFIASIFDNRASVILKNDIAFLKFLFKCAHVPLYEIGNIGVILLCLKAKEQRFFSLEKWDKPWQSNKEIMDYLDSRVAIPFTDEDVEYILSKIAVYQEEKFIVKNYILRALRKIGRPAHYSEITQMINSICLERKINENNVHGSLTKRHNDIVWIGMKGMYALKEWGYERPTETLFNTIAKIVSEKYFETNQPVSFEIIVSEMGKYRKTINPKSLFIALHSNPRVKKISKGLFAPKENDESHNNEEIGENIDKVLKEFQDSVIKNAKLNIIES